MSKKRILKIIFTVLVLVVAGRGESAVTSYRGYSTLPEPPPTSKGESIYRESDCTLCHGELGDGEGFLAAGLDPKPRDFTSFDEMRNTPDLQIENAIRLGVKGTAMPAHPDFNDEQIRELVLYLRSLLADTYLTVNICMTETHTVDTAKEEFEFQEFKVKVDNPELINVRQEGKLIHIGANQNFETFKTMLSTRIVRSYVTVIGRNNTVSLIAVRVHRCVK